MAKITLDKIKALIKDIDNQIQNFADTMLDSAQDNLNDVYDSLSKQMNESLHSLDSSINDYIEKYKNKNNNLPYDQQNLIEADYEVIEDNGINLNMEKEPEEKIEIDMEKK